MCGIFGYAGSRRDAADVVLAGLRLLEYRGYDSWGIAVAHEDGMALEKRVGKIGDATTDLPDSRVGIGHTRWATHGGVTEANAHPHRDCAGRLALIHNGIVSNYRALRDPLARAGHRFRSETDTEVVVHLLEEWLARTPPGPDQLPDALMAAFRQLQGLNAITVLDVHTGQVAAAKSGSPLILGWGDRANLLASDASALLAHTRRVTYVEDGQAALVTPDSIRLFDIETGRELAPVVTQVEWEAEAVALAGHPDFMTKEIHEQPSVLRRIAAGGADHVRTLAGFLGDAQDIYVVGCGTAAHAALVARYFMAQIAGRRLTVVAASEFAHLSRLLTERSAVLALSQSGETIDVIDAVHAARRQGARIAALVNVPGSTLWRLADCAIPLGAGPERCVLATKSFTAKLATLLGTAYALAGQPGAGGALVHAAANEIERLLGDDRRARIRQLAQRLDRHEHLFVLGRGVSYPLALEAALKVKEVSYLHAEGFAGGELKHGVIALIEPGTPCLVLAPSDETQADMLSGAMEVKARGAMLIGLAPESHEMFDEHIAVADLGAATAIVNTVPAQLLAYDLARLRGHDPDKPRNLAKSVTVK
jgi:glucosamine--fructose-6-phosphate aminotransferase (isomerizing)